MDFFDIERITDPETIGNDLVIKFDHNVLPFYPRNFLRNKDEFFVLYSIEGHNKIFYNETCKKTLTSRKYLSTIQPIWDVQSRCFDDYFREKNMYNSNPRLSLAKKPYIVFDNKLYDLEKNAVINSNRNKYFDDMKFYLSDESLKYGKINEKGFYGNLDANIFFNFYYYHNKNIYYLSEKYNYRRLIKYNIETHEKKILIHDIRDYISIEFVDPDETVYLFYDKKKYIRMIHKDGTEEIYVLRVEYKKSKGFFDTRIYGNLSIKINDLVDYHLLERLNYLDYIPSYLIKIDF